MSHFSVIKKIQFQNHFFLYKTNQPNVIFFSPKKRKPISFLWQKINKQKLFFQPVELAASFRVLFWFLNLQYRWRHYMTESMYPKFSIISVFVFIGCSLWIFVRWLYYHPNSITTKRDFPLENFFSHLEPAAPLCLLWTPRQM